MGKFMEEHGDVLGDPLNSQMISLVVYYIDLSLLLV